MLRNGIQTGALVTLGLLAACGSSTAGPAPPSAGVGMTPGAGGTPSGTGAGGAAPGTPQGPPPAPGRQITRVSALQFHRSLEVVTGERWNRFEHFAASLGRPDHLEITEENRATSVPFDRLVTEAALQTCNQAVGKDAQRPPGQGIVLRYVSRVDQLPLADAQFRQNLRYLLLRFHGTNIERDDDPRLQPWMDLLQAQPNMEQAWRAVCVGLVTHPDFLMY